MRFFSISLLLTVGLTLPAYAEELSTTLYLSPRVYQLYGHLMSPFQEHWFNQGALFEPLALQGLQEKVAGVTLCQSGKSSDRVIKLTPHVFFNPQMRVIHGQVVANVYSGGGTLLGVYEGNAQKQGNIGIMVEQTIKSVYAAAMQDLSKKLSLSPQVYEVASEVKLPCNIVAAQEEPKVSFY